MAEWFSRLAWDNNNVGHLAVRGIVPEDIEEILYGVDGENATYRRRRDGDYYVIYGQTGSGRLLKIVGELLTDKSFYVFAGIDMNDVEKRAFRRARRER